jgi:ADP-ribose pyrophosphatase
MHVYLCRGLEHRGRQLDDGEFLELDSVSLDWLLEELRAGRLTDVKTQIVAFWLDKMHKGDWPWPQFVAMP